MGRNYYCEYCDKTFRDVLDIRKNHLKGALHQQMKKEHFDRYRDIPTFLREETAKLPCARLLKGLECNFGSRCHFSHYMPWELQQIEMKSKQKEQAKKKATTDLNNSILKYNDLQLRHNDFLPPSLRQWTEHSFTIHPTDWGTTK